MNINEKVINIANYIIKTNSTIRSTAKKFHVSKSTVHNYLQKRLINIDKIKYQKIKLILEEHIKTRHLLGGEATRQLFLKKRNLHYKKP